MVIIRPIFEVKLHELLILTVNLDKKTKKESHIGVMSINMLFATQYRSKDLKRKICMMWSLTLHQYNIKCSYPIDCCLGFQALHVVGLLHSFPEMRLMSTLHLKK